MASLRYPPIGGNQIVEYANLAAFPVSANAGDFALALDTDNLYVYNSGWVQIAGPGAALALGALDAQAATAAGASLTGGVLSMQSADATHPGLVNTSAQTMAGNKTFSGVVLTNSLTKVGDASIMVDVQNAKLQTTAGVQTLDWQNKYTSDSGGATSVDWQNRILYDSGNAAQLTWSTSGIALNTLTATTVPYLNASKVLTSSAVTPTELGYVSGVTSAIQTQLDAKQSTTLTNTHLLVGNGSNVATDVAASGDVTLANTGAFTVTKIQGSGITTVTPSSLQVLTFDGTNWTPRTATGLSVSGGITLWPTQTAIVSGPTAPTSLYTLLTNPTVTGPVTSSLSIAATTAIIDAHIYNTDLGVTSIPAGAWIFNTYASTSNLTGTNQLIVGVYKGVVGAGTATVTGSGTTRTVTATSSMFVSGDFNASLILTSFIQLPGGFFPVAAYTSATVVTITTPSGYVNDGAGSAYRAHRTLFSNTSIDLTSTSALLYQASNAQAAFTVNTTDRLSLLFFGLVSTGTHTITYYQDGNTQNTSVQTPLSLNHNDLNSLQGGQSSQYYHLTSSEYTGSGTGVFARVTSPSFTTPILGAASGTSLNLSGLTASQAVVTDGSKNLASLAYASANTASALVQRDGSGNFSAGTITAALSGNATTATSATTATTATNATNVATTAVSTNASYYPLFVASSSNGNQAADLDADLTYNPSTNVLTTTTFAGALTGTASGNTTYSANNHGVVLSSATNAMTVIAPDSSTTKVLVSGGASADPTWGTVASGAVTTATFTAPTISTATATGTGSGGMGLSATGWVFTVTSANATIGATYTNNSNTFTVQGTISSGTTLFMLGTGTTSGGTLTRATGSGDATITFSAKVASATYTTPTSPRTPLYLKFRVVGAGGGGSGSGTVTSSSNGAGGTGTWFGANLITANAGSGAVFDGGPTAGGTATVASPALGSAFTGGSSTGTGNNVTSVDLSGSPGAGTPFASGGAGGYGSGSPGAGGNAVTNSGAGGGGGGTSGTATSFTGVGGGAGGYADGYITSPSATYPYVIGTGGAGGSAGTNGAAGGNGAAAYIEVTEFYS